MTFSDTNNESRVKDRFHDLTQLISFHPFIIKYRVVLKSGLTAALVQRSLYYECDNTNEKSFLIFPSDERSYILQYGYGIFPYSQTSFVFVESYSSKYFLALLLSVSVAVCLPIYLSVCLSVCLFVYLSPSSTLSFSPSVCLHVCLYLSSIRLSINLSACVSLSRFTSLCLSLTCWDFTICMLI